jgi:hypothetical protein
VLRSFLNTHPRGLDDIGPLRRQLALLLPELGDAPARADRASVFEALRCALAAIGPALVVLDDLQWSDEATLEVLRALAEPLHTLPLLVLAAYRSDGLPRTHGMRRLRLELRRADHLDEIALRPLERAATAELLTGALGHRPAGSLADAIHDRTQGVPFFVEELAAALRVSGALTATPEGLELAAEEEVPLPETVRDAVLIRATELSDAGRRAAEVAAVGGDQFDLALVTALASANGLTELLDTGMVRECPTGRARRCYVRPRTPKRCTPTAMPPTPSARRSSCGRKTPTSSAAPRRSSARPVAGSSPASSQTPPAPTGSWSHSRRTPTRTAHWPR